jgi:hypothetical protein
LQAMDREMVNDEEVQMGFIADDHLISDELKERSKKRSSVA